MDYKTVRASICVSVNDPVKWISREYIPRSYDRHIRRALCAISRTEVFEVRRNGMLRHVGFGEAHGL